MTLTLPPTLWSLLEDEQYNEYFRRNTKQHKSISTSPAWQIMVQKHDGKWKRAFRNTFAEALDVANVLWDKETEYRDLSIISRRRVFKMPAFAQNLMAPGEEWCGRCRRPTVFTLYPTRHPALTHVPVIVEDAMRCYFCGAQEGIATCRTTK